jgi:hypothetical protein
MHSDCRKMRCPDSPLTQPCPLPCLRPARLDFGQAGPRGEGKGRGDFCWKIRLINDSIPYEVDKGFGIFVSGDDPTIGED